jgi:hypothetical protein
MVGLRRTLMNASAQSFCVKSQTRDRSYSSDQGLLQQLKLLVVAAGVCASVLHTANSSAVAFEVAAQAAGNIAAQPCTKACSSTSSCQKLQLHSTTGEHCHAASSRSTNNRPTHSNCDSQQQ